MTREIRPMTPTSEERREVAARLRHASHTDANLDVTIAIAILETVGEVHRPIAEVVADLIDPTCEMEPMPACVPHHRFLRWRCRKCGLVSFTPFNATGPRYCPYCGHRWVTRDDQ